LGIVKRERRQRQTEAKREGRETERDSAHGLRYIEVRQRERKETETDSAHGQRCREMRQRDWEERQRQTVSTDLGKVS